MDSAGCIYILVCNKLKNEVMKLRRRKEDGRSWRQERGGRNDVNIGLV